MKRSCIAVAACVLLGLLPAAGGAEPTRIDVRVISKGAKFVGTPMGGAEITITDAVTGELLAHGRTEGGTGDTERIMKNKDVRHAPVATPDAAVFHAVLDIDEPRQIAVAARGPLAQQQALGAASATQWLLPGKHVTGGDGFLLELPGFAVDVLAPPVHSKARTNRPISLRANVTTMCGCPLEPDGIWDAGSYEIGALIYRDGRLSGSLALKYAGRTSQFAAVYVPKEPGLYELVVYAYDPATGNTGLDRTTVAVAPPQ